MKKLFKTFVALAAVAALGFSFVSCGNPEDDNDGSRIPASTKTDTTKTDTTKTDTTTEEPKYYTVTFDSKGGSAVEEHKVKKGWKFEYYPSMTPTKDGYYFVYWCSDSDATEKFVFNKELKSDITLYAKWEAVPSVSINELDDILQKFDGGNSSYYLYFLKDGTFRYYGGNFIYAGVYEFTDGYNGFSDGAKFTMTIKCKYWDVNPSLRYWEKYSYGETESYTITMKELNGSEVMYFFFSGLVYGETLHACARGQRF